jgi:GNAT superfamily N-acetyltransferase
VADVVVVHKADMPGADRVEAQVLAAQGLSVGTAAPVLRVSSKTGQGLVELWRAIAALPLRRVGFTAELVTVRTELQPGDLGAVVSLHGVVHARELGFGPTFEAYVAPPLAEFVLRGAVRERLWLAERNGRLVGCIAVVEASTKMAQIRWFLVDATARGRGLGKRLLHAALEFSRERGYESAMLWTVEGLKTAAHLYTSAGFLLVEQKASSMGGVDVVEQRYEIRVLNGAS